MPKLQLATICEKVIVDANGVPTLIGIFNHLNIAIQSGTAFPENAVAPKEWVMFCLWECSPDEVEREFSQVFEVTTPDGKQFGSPTTIRFVAQPGKLRQNVIANSQGVPIGRQGRITVTTHLDLDGRVVLGPMEYGFDVVYVQTT
jgi:hypothetical protein